MSTLMSQEKLLTVEKVAERLGITAADVERLVAEGRLQAFRLGGQFVRFRARDVEALAVRRGRRGARHRRPADPEARPVWREQLREFFYLHDFYLMAALLTILLVAVLIRFA